MDDRVPVLAVENFTTFKKLKTVPVFSFHLLISTIISIVGILLAFQWPESKHCEAYFIMLYCRVGFWILTWIFDMISKYHHNNLRLNGYHEFYRATKMQRGVPMAIVNLWNTVLLAVASGMHHFYGPEFTEKCMQQYLSPVSYIVGFQIAETVIFLFTHSSYISKVVRFNTTRLPPDAQQGISSAIGSVGLVQRGSVVTELLEKQADLIVYLRDHNARLNQKLMQMSNQLRTVTLGPMPSI